MSSDYDVTCWRGLQKVIANWLMTEELERLHAQVYQKFVEYWQAEETANDRQTRRIARTLRAEVYRELLHEITVMDKAMREHHQQWPEAPSGLEDIITRRLEEATRLNLEIKVDYSAALYTLQQIQQQATQLYLLS